MTLHLVGGAVRDSFLDLDSKDWDFTVTDLPDLPALEWALEAEGFEPLATTPDKFTVRARVPVGFEFGGRATPRVCDFVLARKETWVGPGRGDIEVERGTLLDDLARRDFTINAMAFDAQWRLFDPFFGRLDLHDRVLRTVGDPAERFREDGLRVLRALRFAIRLDLRLDPELEASLLPSWIDSSVSTERVREELGKMFAADWRRSLDLLQRFDMLDLLEARGVWLKPTLEAR